MMTLFEGFDDFTEPTVKQKVAGTIGRQAGHRFENSLADCINALQFPLQPSIDPNIFNCKHLFVGGPEILLLNKIMAHYDINTLYSAVAYATGRLATAENGKKELQVDGISVKSSKSDIVLTLVDGGGIKRNVGVSVKQCNNSHPTNDQLFFTTASAFWSLLSKNFESVSEKSLIALRQFCGDPGFRPIDAMDCSNRISTPERYFWEEVDSDGRQELESLFTLHQDEVTRLLLQKGYKEDPFPPEFIFHKTRESGSGAIEVALYSVDEFIELSHKYSPFCNSSYRVKKGRYKEPESVSHLAPRFGVIQMQRGGQKQHPTQLQFNIKAGYFYNLESL